MGPLEKTTRTHCIVRTRKAFATTPTPTGALPRAGLTTFLGGCAHGQRFRWRLPSPRCRSNPSYSSAGSASSASMSDDSLHVAAGPRHAGERFELRQVRAPDPVAQHCYRFRRPQSRRPTERSGGQSPAGGCAIPGLTNLSCASRMHDSATTCAAFLTTPGERARRRSWLLGALEKEDRTLLEGPWGFGRPVGASPGRWPRWGTTPRRDACQSSKRPGA